ncbi:hypothetical protein DL93DRAFT_2161387 [Clavulina sp. PMI_390]|nr:hypothetical protein DL93DRAFT_2161387 [Clavulina sp. PMI_390]
MDFGARGLTEFSASTISALSPMNRFTRQMVEYLASSTPLCEVVSLMTANGGAFFDSFVSYVQIMRDERKSFSDPFLKSWKLLQLLGVYDLRSRDSISIHTRFPSDMDGIMLQEAALSSFLRMISDHPALHVELDLATGTDIALSTLPYSPDKSSYSKSPFVQQLRKILSAEQSMRVLVKSDEELCHPRHLQDLSMIGVPYTHSREREGQFGTSYMTETRRRFGNEASCSTIGKWRWEYANLTLNRAWAYANGNDMHS